MNQNRFAIFSFLVLACLQSYAGWIPAKMDRFTASQTSNSGNLFALGQSLTVEDDYYSNVSLRDDHNYVQIKNRILVGIDRLNPVVFNLPFQSNIGFETVVELQIDWQEYDQVNHSYTAQSVQKSLVVSYDPEQIKSEKDLAVYSFDNGLYVNVTVINVSTVFTNGNTTNIIPPNVFVEDFLQVERYATLDEGFTPTPVGYSGPDAKNEITINLPAQSSIPGTEAFDVEWLFILSDQLDISYQTVEEHKYSFHNNSTRITTTSQTVKIPLIYPRGILIYRYRCRGYDKDNPGTWIFSKWSQIDEGFVRKKIILRPPGSPEIAKVYRSDIYPVAEISANESPATVWIDGFQSAINWQYQQIFAEQDKRGQGIQYFDGLLRGRQSVSYNYDNTDRFAIVGQAIYDFQGRPAISVLPVPVPESDPTLQNLDFKGSFNQNMVGDAYSWRDFDVDYTVGVASLTSRMSTNSGASKYYSSSNPITATNMDVLPNAYGYPFAQTEYMPDGTGRVRRQGMLGADHQLPGVKEDFTPIDGKANHYAYYTPTQVELDRLFGMEVGDYSHYKKVAMTDPNGQVSVSYYDPAGRLIATALSGNSSNTPKLLPLGGSNDFVPVKSDINQYLEFQDEEMPVYVVSKKIYVPNNNSTYTFYYDFEGENITLSCSSLNLCLECIYDMEISIVDELGNEMVMSGSGYDQVTIGTPHFDMTPCATSAFSFKDGGTLSPLVLNLNQGEYTITKRLKLSKKALDDYMQYYDELINSEASACLPSLDDLINEEKALLDYSNCNYTCVQCTDDALAALNAQTITQTEYDQWLETCATYCDQKSDCEILKEALLIDMSPGGQFFSNASISNNITSIDLDPVAFEDDGTTRFDWLNANLSAQSTSIFQSLETILSNTYGSSVNITSWEDVETNWKKEFAEVLLQYHPEYCQYTACMNIESSYDFDEEMMQVDNYSDAHSEGYMNLLNESLVLSNYPYLIDDPFFTSSYGSPYAASMASKLINCFEDQDNPGTYFTIWQAFEIYADQYGTGCVSDQGWFFFRAVYQMKKEEVLRDYYLAQANCPSAYTNPTPNNRKQIRWILDGSGVQSQITFDPAVPSPFDEQDVIDQKNDHCSNVCEGYKVQWEKELDLCTNPLFVNNKTVVINQLYQVCYQGCDLEHPFGSREMDPSVMTSVPRSFEQVMKPYFDGEYCDDLNLSWPMGWDHDYFAGTGAKDNECACDKDKFKPYRGVACPDEVQTEVIDNCLCNEAQNSTKPEYREALQTLDVPDAAKCKNCIDCSHLREALHEYYEKYNAHFYDDPIQDEARLTTFLNIKFKMNQMYTDYLAFAMECTVLNTNDFDGLMNSVSGSNYGSEEYFVLPDDYWNEWLGAFNNLEKIPEEEYDQADNFIMSTTPEYNNQVALPSLTSIIARLNQPGISGSGNYWTSLSYVPSVIVKPSVTADPAVCSCKEIMNVTYQFDNGLITGTSKSSIFNSLYGTNITETEFNELWAECCCYIGTFYDPTFDCSTVSTSDPCTIPELLDDDWVNSTSFSNFPVPGSKLVVHGLDQNCPTQDVPCTDQLVYLDKCGCDKFLAAYEAMYASDPTLQADNVDAEQLRLKLEEQLGIELPPGEPYGNLLLWCFKSWAAGEGVEAPPYVVPAQNGNYPPRAAYNYLEWNSIGTTQLDLDAVHVDLKMPKILSCSTDCENGSTPCTIPSCEELRQWYRDYLDANGFEEFTWPSEMLDGGWWLLFTSEYRASGTDSWGFFPFQLSAMAAYLESQATSNGYCPSSGVGFNDYFYYLAKFCLRPVHWNNSGQGGTGRFGWGETGSGGGVRIYPSDPPACPDRCYRVDRTKLNEVKDYLNKIVKGTPNNLQAHILHKNKANYFISGTRDIPEYYNHFYPSALLASMKQNIRHELHNNQIPQLDYTVTDQNYPGNDRDVRLIFVDNRYIDAANWRLILSIDKVDYFKSTTCGLRLDDEWFMIEATIEVPPTLVTKYCINGQPCTISGVKMMGRITNLRLLDDVTEFTCPECALLCNKPMVPQPVEEPCVAALNNLATSKAKYRYEMERQRLLREFKAEYIAKCRQFTESFEMEYDLNEYNYTLYYYDQADNLIKTVPPEGVTPLGSTELEDLADYKQGVPGSSPVYTNHEYITYYQYNTINGLSWQSTPDGGVSHFWYDRLGRLVLSQNEKQLDNNHYSYTLYDNLGRISEVGEITLASTPNIANLFDDAWIQTNLVASTTKTEITRTIYEDWLFTISGFTPENTLSRVVSSLYYETYQSNLEDYSHATHYSYDIHGNVKRLIQDNPALEDFQQRYKSMYYTYDLISGNVHAVAYQPEEADQFYHHYTYDANNRLIETHTSKNPLAWNVDYVLSTPQFDYSSGWVKESKNYYFPHGPLARKELGQHLVQGTDYSYTIHGWLKSMNSGSMMPEHDPGKDAYTGTNSLFAADAFGLELGYYLQSWGAEFDDYASIRPTSHITDKSGSNVEHWVKNLYNGNISHAVYAIPDPLQLPTTYIPSPRAGRYEYDQLNRLVNSSSFINFNAAGNNWQSNLSNAVVPDPWKENLSYDANGNILSLERTGKAGLLEMDVLTYHYAELGPNANKSNRLEYVDDLQSASFSGNYPDDIETQLPGNYSYDNIGNMVSDVNEEIDLIEWNVYGKIKTITRISGSQKPNLEFAYNSAGQRVMKHVIPNNGDAESYTWYVLDATGNVMAVYETEDEIDGGNLDRTLYLSEYMVYGSSRLGMKKVREELALVVYTIDPGQVLTFQSYTDQTSGIPDIETEVLGFARYELSNHLGNVMAVISDRKLGISNGGNTGYVSYLPEVVNLYDYYPFGAPMPDRSFIAQECSTTNVSVTVTEQESYFESCSGTSVNLVSGFYVLNTSNDDCSNNPPVVQNNDWIADANTTDLSNQGGSALYAEANNPSDAYMVSSKIMSTPSTGADYTLEVDFLAVIGSDCHIEVYDNGSSTVLLTYDVFAGTFGTETWTFTMPANSGDVHIRFVGDPNAFGSSILFDNYHLSYVQNIQTTVCRDLDGYRYGFNGQEKDNQVSGTGNTMTAEFWQYDARLGRRWNIDPIIKYWQSSYSVFDNSPVNTNDPYGLTGGKPCTEQAVVQKGDGIIRFTERNGITIEQLVLWNKDKFPKGDEEGTYMLHPGEILNISDPEPEFYEEDGITYQRTADGDYVIPEFNLNYEQIGKLFGEIKSMVSEALQSEIGKEFADNGMTLVVSIELKDLGGSRSLKGYYNTDGSIGIEIVSALPEVQLYNFTLAGARSKKGIKLKDGKLSVYDIAQTDVMGFRVSQENKLTKDGIDTKLKIDIAIKYNVTKDQYAPYLNYKPKITITMVMDLTKVVSPQYQGVNGYEWSKKSIMIQLGKMTRHMATSRSY